MLFIIEFVYNNNINALINCSSFKINLNFFLRMNFEKLFDFRIKSMLIKQHVVNFNKFIKIFQKILNHVQVKQKKYVNVRMKFMKYVINDYV